MGDLGTLVTHGDAPLEDGPPNEVGGSKDSKIGIITSWLRGVSVSWLSSLRPSESTAVSGSGNIKFYFPHTTGTGIDIRYTI